MTASDRRPDSVLVLSDSLAYYGPEGGLPADDPRIWPSIAADGVGMRSELFGRIGWTTRDVWWAITQDPRIWAAIPTARVVVIAIGGMDTLPSPLPTAVREQIRYLRPSWLRQAARTSYGRLQPLLSPVGWPVALPAPVTVEYLEKIRAALAMVRPDLPVILCLPSTHSSPYYGFVHTARARHTSAMRRWAADHAVPTVDFYPVTAAHFAAEDREAGPPAMIAADHNPDGIHWGFACHTAIGALVTDAVRAATGDDRTVAAPPTPR
ncbi:diglucosylglycerate octanoyltransferase [Williamsia sp. MIQD14]|uniref:diglucosylglycerate octanoyltransferase n=1 Tax=Williamsia sp. MIQD14 TaxID=3425703 RepID=UPI003DA142D8